MSEVLSVDVSPKRSAGGTYILEEITTYNEYVPTRSGARTLRKTKKVWPPTKQTNGRGLKFPTYRAAVEHFAAHRDRNPLTYGSMTMTMLKSFGLDQAPGENT